jgi:hypothetical protein
LARAHNCTLITADNWKSFANERLPTKVRVFAADQDRIQTIRDATSVLRSTSAAYAGEFLFNPNMLWLGVAGHAMSVVADFLQGLQKEDQEFSPNRLVAVALAKGNLAVYNDLFWQFTAFNRCGAKPLIHLLETNAETSIGRADKFIGVWKAIEAGHFVSAAIDTGYIEQSEILQPTIYKNPLSWIGGRYFNDSAAPPLAAYISAVSFNDYCKAHKLSPNFAVLSTRWAWMQATMIEVIHFIISEPQKNSELLTAVKLAQIMPLE